MTVKCECGKEFEKGRQLHAHKLTCKTAGAAATCCEDPDWKLLSKLAGTANEHLIERYKARGFKEFCDNCWEVR